MGLGIGHDRLLVEYDIVTTSLSFSLPLTHRLMAYLPPIMGWFENKESALSLILTTSLLYVIRPSPSLTGEVLRGDRIVNTPYEVRTLLT